MKTAVIGLGLIGGSLAKALKARTEDIVLGWDIAPDVREKAFRAGCVDEILTAETLKECDLVLVALYPEAAAEYIVDNAAQFKKSAIVADMCGLKRRICAAVEPVAKENGFTFIGSHPMAGREKGGFEQSLVEMFDKASLIVTPYDWTEKERVEEYWNLMKRLGFKHLQISDPEEHDEMISYTSQLAHLLTCAYMIDPLSMKHEGFSAGSFRDMTRVARINENMWSPLFIENRDYLCREAELLAGRILDISRAVRNQDDKTLKQMLRKSREIKEAMLAAEEAKKQQ